MPLVATNPQLAPGAVRLAGSGALSTTLGGNQAFSLGVGGCAVNLVWNNGIGAFGQLGGVHSSKIDWVGRILQGFCPKLRIGLNDSTDAIVLLH